MGEAAGGSDERLKANVVYYTVKYSYPSTFHRYIFPHFIFNISSSILQQSHNDKHTSVFLFRIDSPQLQYE